MLSNMPWLEIRVCMRQSKNQQIAWKKKKKKAWKLTTQCTLAPPRVSIHLLPSKMGHGCMSSTLAKQKQTKDHSPSMMLSELPKQNDQVP